MVQRLTTRRRSTYNTASNKKRIVRTPGGRLAYIYCGKKPLTPKCTECKCVLGGLVPARPRQLANMKKRSKTVNRAYGGNKCGECVANRIARAFLAEEQKIVKKVLKAKKSQESTRVKGGEPVSHLAIEKKEGTTAAGKSSKATKSAATTGKKESSKKATTTTAAAPSSSSAMKKSSALASTKKITK